MIADNLRKIKNSIPSHVKLVAVSKTKPETDILEAYHAGHVDFGENKVQELVAKAENLPKDIVWHMIGHLQTNKVKYIVPMVSMVHSVDKEKLLKTIEKEAAKAGRTIRCLLQFHIAEEETKYGLSYDEGVDILKKKHEFPHVRFDGVMGMATFTGNKEQIRGEFRNLQNIFIQLRDTFFKDVPHFKEISMGMSEDYMVAIEEGSTIIRVGSAIFGERLYS